MLPTKDGGRIHELSEGSIAYIEAIEFLRAEKPVRTSLKWNAGLAKAANDHAKDIGESGGTSTFGSDGSLPTDRISRYMRIDSGWAESSCFGMINAQEVIE